MKGKITISDLEAIGDNWLNRTRRLADVMHSAETEKQRDKAFRLWFFMSQRVTRVSLILADYRRRESAMAAVKFKPGGISTATDHKIFL